MADDPDRDILPVKDSAAYNIPNNKVFSSLYEDVVQRQCAAKLPRDDLEDRYLRLCEENMQLKKHCNKQHEKIKRLSAKMLRVVSDRKRGLSSASDRQGLITENILGDQQNRIQKLEAANAQLQERLLVLKSQLSAHSRLHIAAHCSCSSRSPSRSPIRQVSRPTSRNNVDHSEPPIHHEDMLLPDSRKCSPNREKKKIRKVLDKDRRKDQKAPNSGELELLRNQLNIMEQDMEMLREESIAHISTLEEELVLDKRKQVTDDVEMIRLKRGLQQQAVQLAALQAQTLATNRDVGAIQGALQQAHQENDMLHDQLLQAKQKYVDIQKDFLKMESTSKNIKELEQTIGDLKQENATLKAHNDRLLQLSAASQEIEKVRSQQLSERDSSLRSQLAEVQSSLTGMLSEKDVLKQALEEEKKTVSSLRQAHEELLSKFKDMQSQYHSLEQQLIGSTRKEETDKRIPSLESSRSAIQSLLQPIGEYPVHKSYEQLRDATGRTGSKSKSLASNVTISTVTLVSDMNARNIETIIECPSGESKCGCTSPSALSCICGGKSTSTASDEIPGETSRRHKSEERTETELMNRSLTSANESYSSTHTPKSKGHDVSQKSLKIAKTSYHPVAMLDKGTDPMSSASPQLNVKSFKPPSVGGKRMVSEETQTTLSSIRTLNLPPETNESISTSLSQQYVSYSNTQGNISKSVAAAENIDISAERAMLGCSSDIDYSSVELNEMAALPSNEPYVSLDAPQELEKCRELLRVQYNLNELYKKMLGKMKSPSMHTNKEQDSISMASMLTTSQPEKSISIVPTPNLQKAMSSINIDTDFNTKRMAALPSNEPYLFLDTPNELEKCRELLRVQYNLNGLYKKMLGKMKSPSMQTNREQDSISMASMLTMSEPEKSISIVPTPKLQKDMPSMNIDTDLNKKRSLLRVGVGQGLFELHTGYLQLSSEGIKSMQDEYSMFLTWSFYNQDMAYTPTKSGPEAQFDCSAVYRVEVDKEFVQYIQKDKCEVNLYTTSGDKRELIAIGLLSFAELLDFPQNKLQAFVQLKSASAEETDVVFGVLHCWYRLSCDVNLLGYCPSKYEQRNEVQFDEIVQIKTLTPVPGSPEQLVSEHIMPYSLPQSEDVKEMFEIKNDEQLTSEESSSLISKESEVTDLNEVTVKESPPLVNVLNEDISEEGEVANLNENISKGSKSVVDIIERVSEDRKSEDTDNRTISEEMEPPLNPVQFDSDEDTLDENDNLPQVSSNFKPPFKQPTASSRSSMTGNDSSATSLEMKSEFLGSRDNSKDLTTFQKRMKQLRKGLYNDGSFADLDEDDRKASLDGTLKEIHNTSKKSEESIVVAATPIDLEKPKTKRLSTSSEGGRKASTLSSLSQKDQLSDVIRRSKEALKEDDTETREFLEMLDGSKGWNRPTPRNSSNASVLSKDVPESTEPTKRSPRADASPPTKEKENKDPNAPEITVEIHWMTLDPESTPLKNPDVVQLYVEFTFLGLRGSELETAMSLPKPTTADQRLVFNYSKAFDVSKDNHKGRRVELRKLLSRTSVDHSIHFVVISEPLAEESNTKDCEELGQASVNIQTMLLEGRDYDPINIAILSVDGRQENIGNLNISVRGIETLMTIGDD